MTCQICEASSRFYPLCKDHFKLKAEGKVTKCGECGKWKDGTMPLCKECWLNNKKDEERKSKEYKPSKLEQDDADYRTRTPATIPCADGHIVRSKTEKIIDDWLYNHKIAHAYERKITVDGEEMYCDFFLDYEKKVWIEFWGLNDEKYVARKERKKTLYAKTNRILIELSEKDIGRIHEILPEKLRPYLPKEFDLD